MLFRAIYKRHRKNMAALKKWKAARARRLSPANHIVLNNVERQLHVKPLSYTLTCTKEGEHYVICGAISADTDAPKPKAALCAFIFIGADGKRVEADSSDKLSYSTVVGYYRYLTATRAASAFRIGFTVPRGCRTIKLKIRPWKEEHLPLLLESHTRVLKEVHAQRKDMRSLLEDVHIHINDHPAISSEDAETLISHYADTHKVSRYDVASTIFHEYQQHSPHAVAGFGAFAFSAVPQEQLYEDVYACLHRAGTVSAKHQHLSIAKDIGFLQQSDLRFRKSEEEYRHFTQGFPLSRVVASPAYKPEKSAVYMLHNSLPYNSGGYATRTHGLLSNIRRESGFQIAAMTRPGFPSDHQAYISKPLPKPLPPVHHIDDVDYYIGDQTLRRSKLTFHEYIDRYSDEVRKLATMRKACVIHAASNHPNGLAAVMTARSLGISSIYEVRGLWEVTRMSRDVLWGDTEQFALTAKLEAQALHEADFGITITHALKDIMHERGVTKDIHVVPNGVDTAAFSPIEKDMDLAKQLHVEHRIVIGYAGSVVNYEGLDDLLYALHILVHRGVTNIAAVIVGDGAYHQTLKDLTVELELQDYVIFTGRVPHTDVQRYLSIMDIMPFPRKPFLVCEAVSPIKPMEAMAVGKATLFSSCAAMLEMVEDGVTGMVFEKGNREDFAEKLHTLIHSESLRHTLGNNALTWVRKERDWRIISETVTDIYREAYARTIHRNHN